MVLSAAHPNGRASTSGMSAGACQILALIAGMGAGARSENLTPFRSFVRGPLSTANRHDTQP
jgi:hypothetical protein